MISEQTISALEWRKQLGPLVTIPSELDDLLELLAREEAQRRLLPFCQYVTPWFETPRHIDFLAPFYEAIEQGDIDRLMVEEPPRHGKTNLGLHFLAYYFGKNPSDQIVLASYNAMIAGHFGGKVRNILSRPEYLRLCDVTFGAKLDPDLQGRELWQTLQGGVFRAAGMSAGTSGFGGCGVYIDDFTKGREEADSEVSRRKIAETYSAELYPRLMPRSNGKRPWIVMTYTPWHELDLGQEEVTQMKAGNGDWWWIVRLPAIAEADDPMGREIGEALWPERYPLPVLNRIKGVLDRINPRDWPALYQCRPAAMEGTFYKLEMMPDLDRTKVGRTSQVLVTDWGAGGDPTAHGIFAIDSNIDVSWRDGFREACDTGKGVEASLDLIAKWRAIGNGISARIHAKGVLDKAVEPLLQLRARQRNIPLPPLTTYAETGSKEAMSGTAQGYMAAGRFRFDHQHPLWPWMRDECLAFPSGAHDEGPDLLKMLGLHLDKVVAPPKVALTTYQAPRESVQW